MYLHYVKLLNENYQIDAQIKNNLKYASFFQDYLGALDRTHIDVYIPYKKRTPYKNYKGTLSQNVIAVVTFNFCYCYVLPRCERFVHDNRILTDAVVNHGFSVLEKEYYFANAGYCNSDYAMIPYWDIQYHLWKYNLAEQKSENAKKLFNLWHSSLKNAVKRIFGIDKRRFKILTSASEYNFHIQIRLVFAFIALHNFIKDKPSEKVDYFEEEEENTQDPSILKSGTFGYSLTTLTKMNQKRDRIANQMWTDYVDILSCCRRTA